MRRRLDDADLLKRAVPSGTRGRTVRVRMNLGHFPGELGRLMEQSVDSQSDSPSSAARFEMHIGGPVLARVFKSRSHEHLGGLGVLGQ
jgi:hypothetical protein